MDTIVASPARQQRLIGVKTVIVLSQAMSGADVACMTIALAGLGAALHVGPAVLQWILSAELLACGGFLILGGRLVDMLGIRPMLLLGAALFVVGMLPGVFTDNLAIMIPGRVLVGLGLALIGPASVGVITDQFDAGPARDRAFGLFTLGQSAGFFGGMVVAGLVAGVFGWKGPFVADLLLGLTTGLVALASVRTRPGVAAEGRLDLPGAVAVTSGLGLLVYALSSLGEFGIASLRVMAGLAGAVVLLAAFVLIELRTSHPLVRFSIFRGNTRVALFLEFAFNSLSIAVFVPALLYVQHVGHLAPASLGLIFIPALLTALVMARLVPRALGRFSSRFVAFLAFVPYITLLLPVLGTHATAGAPHLAFVFALICVCASTMSSVTGIVTIFAEATRDAPIEERGLISAAMLMTAQVGATVGVAVSASTLASHAPGAGENFSLTFLAGLVTAALFGVVTLVTFRSRPPLAVAAHH